MRDESKVHDGFHIKTKNTPIELSIIYTYYSSNMPFLELMMRGNVALSYLITTKRCSIFPFELNLSYLGSPI